MTFTPCPPPDAADPSATGEDAVAILSRWRRVTGPALRDAVDGLHPWPARMAAFTFGWADGDVPPAGTGGKGLRVALTLLGAQAAGAPAESALAGAVAVELVHAFSLVHDDIMDGDEQRRHRPTVWKAYGIGPAVLAGDGLLAMAVATLAAAPGGGAAAAVRRLSSALVDLVCGQSEDLTFEARPWTGPDAVTVEEYTAMAEAKTGALLGCAAAVGTLLGGGSARRAAAMDRMGRELGLAFQVTDDMLGIWGDPAVTGKPVAADLRRGKKTLPVLAALRAGTPPARALAALLAAAPGDGAADDRARELIEAAGGRAFARERARVHLDRALRAVGDEDVPAPVAAELAALCRFVADRGH